MYCESSREVWQALLTPGALFLLVSHGKNFLKNSLGEVVQQGIENRKGLLRCQTGRGGIISSHGVFVGEETATHSSVLTREIPRTWGLVCGRHFYSSIFSWQHFHGNLLQYSYLGNPMDRGAWCAAVCGVTKESEMTEPLNRHICTMYLWGF